MTVMAARKTTMPNASKLAKPSDARRFKAWSFSRWNDYRKCPAYACFKHVDRRKEPDRPAFAKGRAYDEAATSFARKEAARKKCPPELAAFEGEFRALQKQRVVAQQQWAFDADWAETDWFGDGAWCRVVLDCCYVDAKRNVLVVIDYKTGRQYPYHDEQLSLYALAGMLKFPNVVGVEVQLWYLELAVITPEESRIYARSELAGLKRLWESSVRKMMADRRFDPRPNDGCRYCHFRKENGGPCEY